MSSKPVSPAITLTWTGGDYYRIAGAGRDCRATVAWLKRHARFFDNLSAGPGATTHAIRLERTPKFLAYCAAQGVIVEGATRYE